MKNWRMIWLALLFLVVSLSCSLFVPGTPTSPSTGVSGLVPKPSGLITSVTLAKDVTGAAKDPVNPTTVFASTDVFHAVVQVAQVPADTAFKAIWYAVDVGSAASGSQVLFTSDYKFAGGDSNIDFSLTPDTSWPTGTYQIEVYVNGVLDQVENFSVK